MAILNNAVVSIPLVVPHVETIAIQIAAQGITSK